MDFIFKVFLEAWHLLLDSSVYILFGLLMAWLYNVVAARIGGVELEFEEYE